MDHGPCKDCAGKGFMRVRNPKCLTKKLRLPCDRCKDTGKDPGPDVPRLSLPYIDLDVEAALNPKTREW